MSRYDGLRGTPTWFGPAAAPLFGVVHVPSRSNARGGVVICPPLGKEHVDTYRGLKLLAQQLCAAGFAVLRFDYLGTGDSAGDQGARTAIEDYFASLRVAVDYLRDGGVDDVAIVGLRTGALLAGAIAHDIPGLRSLVLWDPVTDGRHFLREQRALYRMTVGPEFGHSDGESILGLAFSPEAAAALKSLMLPSAFDPAVAVLVLTRPERATDTKIAALSASQNCEVGQAPQQAPFVEPLSFVVEIPVPTLSDITAWIDMSMPARTADFTPDIRHKAVVARLPDGRAVVEKLVELGPNRLFGIRTAVAGTAPDAPMVLMHNTSCEHRAGSGRIWPESAREIAGLGLSAMRYDRRGIGDTGTATTDHAWVHSSAARADVLDAVDAIDVAADRLMMTGVCSGAWNSAYGALRRGAASVVLVNLRLYALRRVETAPEKRSGLMLRNGGLIARPELGDSPQRTRRVRLLVKHVARRWLPYWAWMLLGRLGFVQAPEVLLGKLCRHGVVTELLLSPPDFEWFELQRGRRGMVRLARRGCAPAIVRAPSGDHALLQRELQSYTRRRLVRAARGGFAAVSPDSGHAGPSTASSASGPPGYSEPSRP